MRHLSPCVCTKRRRMDPQSVGTQGFGIQGNVKLLALRLKYGDCQNVKKSEILRIMSIRGSSLLILTLTGNVTVQCFWIAAWKVWSWTCWAGNGRVSLVCFSKSMKQGQQPSHNEFNCFKLELRFSHILKRLCYLYKLQKITLNPLPFILYYFLHNVVHKIKVYLNWQINPAPTQEKQ